MSQWYRDDRDESYVVHCEEDLSALLILRDGNSMARKFHGQYLETVKFEETTNLRTRQANAAQKMKMGIKKAYCTPATTG
jgi:hypothetical protein